MNALRPETGQLTGEALTQETSLPERGIVALVLLCSANYFLDGLVHSILGPLAPGIARDLGLSRAALGPIFSANLIGQCLGLVVTPMFVSRFGHRKVLVLTITGFGIAQAITAFSTSGAMLLGLRIVTGFFLGGALPSGFALVAAKVPLKRRGTAISLLFTGYGLGAVVSGLIAGLFVGVMTWRTAMMAIGALCLIAAACSWRWLDDAMPEGPQAGPERTVSVAAIVRPPYRLGTLMLWLMFVSMLTINYCLNSWLPTLLTDVGREASFAALCISMFAGGGLVATLVIGPLIDLFGSMRVLCTFLSVAAIALFAVGKAIVETSPAVLLCLLAIGGFASLGAYSGINVVLADFYPANLRAVGVGWTKSVGRLGTVLAPIIIGQALEEGISEATVTSLFAVPAVLTLFAYVTVALEIAKSRKQAEQTA